MSNIERAGEDYEPILMLHPVDLGTDQFEEPYLPNMAYATEMSNNLRDNPAMRHFPDVSQPIPGKYSNRAGEKIAREELCELVDKWLDVSAGHPIFVIQGGNRYISNYVRNQGVDAFDIKLSSIDKAPLSHHLRTLISREEADEHVVVIADGVISTGTRAVLLEKYGGSVVDAPFSKVTQDQTLETELAEAVRRIKDDDIEISNLEILRQIVSGTEFAERLSRPGELHFIDDLFYRGRTIYTLGTLVRICGGDPSQIRLTTIGCDPKSRNLSSPYHKTLRPDALYPFENSVRTEQGYWQDVGDKYEFTDMGAYFEYLHQTLQVSLAEATERYLEFQTEVISWGESVLGEGVDPSLVFPLAWLLVYHDVHGLTINVEKIVDQKGYRIGACAPFMELLDRFISQEETVEVRLHFKQLIRHQLDMLRASARQNPKPYLELVAAYNADSRGIDYGSLANVFSV